METFRSLVGMVVDLDMIDRYGWRMVQGLGMTLQLVAISVSLGFFLGLAIAHARLSKSGWLTRVAWGYTTFFRGTPLLCQVYLIYYGFGTLLPGWRVWLEGAGLWALFRDAWIWVVAAFILNSAAYQAEAMRGAIQSVPRGQLEAAQALGLHNWTVLRKIIWPQAMLVALRPLGNELILMIKASSVASLATIYDLMGQTKFIFARSFDLTIYLYAAIIYLVMVESIRRLWNGLEARMLAHRAGR